MMRISTERGAPLTRPVSTIPPTPLERLFTEHHAAVFRAAYRVTGNAADAEDVLQTVFLRLASRSGRGAASEPPGTPQDLPAVTYPYLARAAVNASLDVVRSRGVRKDVDLDDDTVGPAGPASDPASVRETRELRRRLRDALGDISPKMAEIFCLRHLEGLPNREIAAIVGCTAASVAVLLIRAKARLRYALQETEITSEPRS